MLRMILIVLLLFPIALWADSFCEGKITNIGVSRSGNVILSGPDGLNAVYICNVNTEQNNVAVGACKTMYSTLLTAQARGKSVQVTFNPGIESCSALQPWRWAENVNWIFLRN